MHGPVPEPPQQSTHKAAAAMPWDRWAASADGGTNHHYFALLAFAGNE
jgi:hypothetical protein